MADKDVNNENVALISKKKQNISKSKNFAQRKRQPQKLPPGENDVYVTSRSDFKGQLQKALKVFEEGGNEVNIHGLGRAVTKAANLSLQLQEELCHSVQLSTNTATVDLQDDWEPELDEDVPYSSKRSVSALNIRITRHPDFLKRDNVSQKS